MSKKACERVAVGIMVAGVAMVCQPFFQPFFRFGFVVTILGIVCFTVAAHLKDGGGTGGKPGGGGG
jgi:hypothetical protein